MNLDVIGNIYEDIELLDEDLVNVERKAKAFDEIQSNLSHVLDLGKYETLDYKDCQILKSILQEVKMTNQVTENQLQELLQIQKNFDSRIPTLNLQDSKIAYVVEFFEWFNTLETFKNWKKKPGKPLDIQLDELADMLAFD